jgi:hypothetical protein
MPVEALRQSLDNYYQKQGSSRLDRYFLDTLVPLYKKKVARWQWANDEVLDPRPLWVQRKSDCPEIARLLESEPTDKQDKILYGLDDQSRVVIAQEEDDNTREIGLFDYFDNRVEGVHFRSYNRHKDMYMFVTEQQLNLDGQLLSYEQLVSRDRSDGAELETETYEYDDQRRVKFIRNERKPLDVEAERAKLQKQRESIQSSLAASGQAFGFFADIFAKAASVLPTEPETASIEYNAIYDATGLLRINQIAKGTETPIFQRSDKIPVAFETGVLSLSESAEPLRDFVINGLKKFAKEHPEVPVSCVAIWGEPYNGWLYIGIDTAQRNLQAVGESHEAAGENWYGGDHPAEFEFSEWAECTIDEWRQYYYGRIRPKVIDTGLEKHEVSTADEEFTAPFVGYMARLLKELQRSGELPEVKRQPVCYLGVQLSRSDENTTYWLWHETDPARQ